MADVRGVRDAYERELMGLPNVQGVGVGKDEATGDEVVLVLVTHKVALTELRPEDVVPSSLEGVPVRVRSVGEIAAEDI